MAGSAMVFTETVYGSVKKIKAAWTSDDTTGAVSGTATNNYSGQIIGAITVPGTAGTAPTNLYDVVVNDPDSVDVALGALIDRSSTLTQGVAAASMSIIVGKLTIAVTNAGNAKTGVIYLYIR
jgi:hypothetical protein